MWRSRRWRKLLNILDGLPRTSAYAQAIATDELLAEEMAEHPETVSRTGKWSREHRDFTAEVEMLTAVFDRLGELIRVVAATHGSRAAAPSPAPRPTYAIERVRRRRAWANHERLVSRIKKPAG